MNNLESLITVEYHTNKYTVATIIHAKTKIPILLDRHIYKILKRLDKKWYINDKNHIYCLNYKNDKTYPVYMHDIVFKLNKTETYKYGVPIIHINNIHFDNRLENLQFDIRYKNYSKNMKKKQRTIDLSQFNINVEDIPTYIWYLKPDKTHGDRFIVEIPDELSWRSTASKKVSLRYKLEEAKKFLRHVKQNRPDIFDDYSMNGDLTSKGLQLYKEFHKIIKQAGFDMNQQINKTNTLLVEDTTNLTNFEIYLLHNYRPNDGLINIGETLKEYEQMLNDNLID